MKAIIVILSSSSSFIFGLYLSNNLAVIIYKTKCYLRCYFAKLLAVNVDENLRS